jgi:UDP-N-acetylglucosamine:LPS N-acetylglucosamine transferase
MPSKITLIYVDSGGGHRAAATALCETIRRQRRGWNIEMVCIQDILDGVDFIRKYTGIPFQEVYNILLRKGWTLGSAQMIRVMHLLIRLSHASQVRALRNYFSLSDTDLVVSLIPHFNRAIKEALESTKPGVPFVTILTDIADYPPHFWIEKDEQDQYVICGSRRAAIQARETGLAPDRILRTSGMILNPAFYEPLAIDRASERIRLGLRPDLPIGLVLFGGEGSDDMLTIARALNRSGQKLQLIMLCGKNEKLAAGLRESDHSIPMFVDGFTRQVPFYMELADFFIGKPGPGSISEALAKGLPVIVQKNAWTLAHERYNADWIEELGVGLVVRSFRDEISAAVKTLLSPENFARFRQQAARIRNNAVYEIPDILEFIVEQALSPALSAPNQFHSDGQSLPETVHSV